MLVPKFGMVDGEVHRDKEVYRTETFVSLYFSKSRAVLREKDTHQNQTEWNCLYARLTCEGR